MNKEEALRGNIEALGPDEKLQGAFGFSASVCWGRCSIRPLRPTAAVRKVDLFGNLRILAYLKLPEAFRRLLRPSSSLGA